MTNKEPETRSICSVLDDFNRIFGETAKYVVNDIDSEEKAIYIRMLYTNDSGMAKITVTEGSEGPRFILYFNDIYINTCLMPDKKRALRFNTAVEKFAGDRFTFESGGAFLSIEDCFLKKAIDKTITDVFFYKNDLSGESYVGGLKTDVTALTKSAKALVDACEFLGLLQKAKRKKIR